MEHYPLWRMILDITNFVITWGVAIYVYRDKRKKETDAGFEQNKKALSDQGMRLAALESDVKHPNCPRHEALDEKLTRSNHALEEKLGKSNGALNRRLDDLHGDIRELTGSVKGLNRAVDLMNEFLINNKKG